ncbi:DotU family type IV/VI secretion system protein [Rahnella sp. SAP-1]|jgi:type VI secretion system protein ImpK|uniref:DotU family type IV/VI secretion system protein n=1 Tax=Rouxiella aceris TaxID=2703884 RepID=A0A848MS44_9GAMM|nr:type VI secretion system protein TssL, short form [Rouxiella aceris]NMP29886.1 DotU family type IV/VI secretion system protein [Rouxiella aceris]
MTFSTEQHNAIEQLLYPTWLWVGQLRNGWQIGDSHGFYRKTCELIEHTQSGLGKLGLADSDIEHIVYAQCALLDSTVMNRKSQDIGYQEWLNTPLQVKFFKTLGAGENLWQRIRGVLREPSANPYVLACFHRVLLLGFSGQYREEDAPDRAAVIKDLALRVPPYSLSLDAPNIVQTVGRKAPHWMSSLTWRGLLAAGILLMLWWSLDHQLQSLMQQLLS